MPFFGNRVRGHKYSRALYQPVGLDASKAKIGPVEDSFCHIRRAIARLSGKKAVKNEPLRPICSQTLPKPDRLLAASIKHRGHQGSLEQAGAWPGAVLPRQSI